MPLEDSPPLKRFVSLLPRAPDVRAGSVFDAWHLRVLSQEEFSAIGGESGYLSESQLLYLAWFGSLAPTSHNTVPQRFQLRTDGGQLGLWLDRKFVLPESDPRGRQATISCGCVIAYLSIASIAYGWRVVVHDRQIGDSEVLPIAHGGARYTELARLSFERTASERFDARWLNAMIARKSVRADFDPQVAISDELAQEMKFLIAKYPHTRMNLLTDAVSLVALGKFQELADTTVYNRERFARELGQWLLENDDESSLGMRGSEFGLSDESARRFHRGLRGEAQLLPDEVAGLAKSANKALRSASAVVVLTVDEDSTCTRLEVGRAFGELGLLLQMHGFVTAMHAAITEVEAPNLAMRGRLRTRWRPSVIFRAGTPARVEDGLRPHSSRPPVTELILDDSHMSLAAPSEHQRK